MQYRREIDGLRAVAVIPVILFHAGFTIFSGGYVGVDIFFVISGYLITSIIISELEQGKFSILRFYERRARRILPALFFVMLVCIPFAWMWMLPSQFKDFSQSLVAVAVFASNILFWRESGYFAAASEEKPLLHTWSLAVEEQYYMLFPIFLILLWRFGRSPVFYSIIIISIISLVLSEWGWRNKPSVNFYLAPTRAWELLAGSICAFLQFGKTQKSNNVLSVFGLVLIVFAIFVYDESTPFPSVYALAPVVGTALIIMYGARETWVARFLSLKGFVGIGLVSYSAYLWHQPLFAFARIRSLNAPEQWQMLLLAIASLVLAYFSWRYVEHPFRKRTVPALHSQAAIFSVASVTGAAFIAFGLYGHIGDGLNNRLTPTSNKTLIELLSSIKGGTPNGHCYANRSAAERASIVCDTFYDEQNKRTIAVYGDSHSSALLPAFQLINKTKNFNIVHSGIGGCPPLLGVYIIAGNYDVGVCNAFSETQFNYAVDNNVEIVFLVARWALYTFGNHDGSATNYLISDLRTPLIANMHTSRIAFTNALTKTVEQYNRAGITVVLVEQIPMMKTDPENLLEKLFYSNIQTSEVNSIILNAEISISSADLRRSYSSQIVVSLNSDNVFTVNFDTFFANGSNYKWSNGEISYYRDKDHLSKAGAEALAPYILEQVNLIEENASIN